MPDVFIFIVTGTVLLVLVIVELHPTLSWSCLIGRHKYIYSGRCSGMVFVENSREIIGSERAIYICRCGKQKPAAHEDYV